MAAQKPVAACHGTTGLSTGPHVFQTTIVEAKPKPRIRPASPPRSQWGDLAHPGVDVGDDAVAHPVLGDLGRGTPGSDSYEHVFDIRRHVALRACS